MKTSRGFEIKNFVDIYGEECSIQESSLATKPAIWFGINDAKPQIMTSDAIKMGIDTKGQTNGWVKYPIPEQVSLNTRMHLDQEMVKRLLPVLQHFAKTGGLP